jgi:NAD(P)-dependent dehydrogenase (short-subunit alcohol dehydrogenase family)
MEAAADTSENFQGSIVEKLEKLIGAENVKTSKMERLLYSHDMAPLPKEAQVAFKVIPDIVVRPRSAEDVAKVVKLANREGMPITPRGASTWGLAGSTPAFGGILIDVMSGMSKIVAIDEENMTITAQAGASWKQVYDAAWEKGFLLGSYPSSFPSATIAGWISTAGIGVGNYKYGSAGDNIRSMKVVVPDGSIVETGFPTLSDNMSGYNLNRLFVGAEGTLGVICEVTFKLSPKPEVLRPLAYAFPSLDVCQNPIRDITERRTTVDGYEYTFALDHLCSFLLTNLLIDKLKASAPSRIINVSSSAHILGKVHFDDLMLEKGYSPFKAYGQAKLANILFTRELARRLEGTGVTANSLHPGLVKTHFGLDLKGVPRLGTSIIRPFGIGPEKGAKTSIYLASSPEVNGLSGKYFVQCKPAWSTKRSKDEDDALRLWEVSEKLTGTKSAI